MWDGKDANEVGQHANFLPDPVLQLVQVVGHPAGKVRRCRRVIPADVLAQHRLHIQSKTMYMYSKYFGPEGELG